MFTQSIKVAERVLDAIPKLLVIGAGNISIAKHSKNLHIDTIAFSSSLFSPQRAYSHVNVLTTINVKKYAKKQTKRNRAVTDSERFPGYEGLSYFLALKFALETGSSYCHEFVLAALYLLKKYKYTGTIHCLSFKNWSHTFLVLNLPPGAKINDFRTWGSETVILDPWLNEVCTGIQFLTTWKDKISYMKKKGVPTKLAEFKKYGVSAFNSFDAELLLATQSYLTPKDFYESIEPYESLLFDRDWAVKLLDMVSCKSEKITLQLLFSYKYFYGPNLTPQIMLKVLELFPPLIISQRLKLKTVNLYKENYQANNATIQQLFCYLLTADDITVFDPLIIKKFLTESNVISNELIQNITCLNEIITQSKSNPSEESQLIILHLMQRLIPSSAVNLQGVLNFENISIAKLCLKELMLMNISFRATETIKCDFSDAVLNNATIHNAIFSDCVMENCNLLKSSIDASVFNQCILMGVDFTGTTFKQCVFKNCELSSAIFIDVNLANIHFFNSNLNDTIFIPQNIIGDTKLLETYLNKFYIQLLDHPQISYLSEVIAKNLIVEINNNYCDANIMKLDKILYVLNSNFGQLPKVTELLGNYKNEIDEHHTFNLRKDS